MNDMGEYPDFIETCGYGEPDGMLGVNCRHSFAPFYPGVSVPRWSAEELEEYKSKTYEFTAADGSKAEADAYEASQILRGLEREVREWKRREAVTKAGGMDATAEREKLRYWQGRLRAFCEETGLRRQHGRERIARA